MTFARVYNEIQKMKIIQVKTHKLYIIKSDRTIKFRLLNSYLIAN